MAKTRRPPPRCMDCGTPIDPRGRTKRCQSCNGKAHGWTAETARAARAIPPKGATEWISR
jgi:tRNA(Ile2) C34 agmatinyltransferase TiaS